QVGVRHARGPDLGRVPADGDHHHLSLLRSGCNLELHVQDNEIVKVTSPLDHDVTQGHLCVKGRFGYQFVQQREGREPALRP
ncbi:Molybdopterin oxidoreductase Fe4S4 region domain protein, partial [mine drainage metagenome]